MPYIKQEERGNMAQLLKPPATVGQLNYLITSICLAYARGVNAEAGATPGNEVITYSLGNDIIGALECCKLEMYRRQLAPYEDKKALDNGDIRWLQS